MTGTESRAAYSWDTCVFVALLKKEADKPLANIMAVANDIQLGKADFVISTIVITELLDLITDHVLADEFQAFIRRPNVLVVNVDPRVARRAARLRAEWRTTAKSEKEDRNIKTPDAIIIATAILAGATVLHSLEPRFIRHHKSLLVNLLEITTPMLAGGVLVLPHTIIPENSGVVMDDSEAHNKPGLEANQPRGDAGHVSGELVAADSVASALSGLPHQAAPTGCASEDGGSKENEPTEGQFSVSHHEEGAPEEIVNTVTDEPEELPSEKPAQKPDGQV